MGYYLGLPLLMIAAALQSSLLQQLPLYNGTLDLVFVLVILWSVHAPLNEGLVWAFSGGIMQDLLSMIPVGTSVVGMVIMVFAINGLSRQLYGVNLVLVIGFIVIGTLLQQILLLVGLFAMGQLFNLLDMIRFVILPTLLLNLAATLPLYGLIRIIQRRIYRPQLTDF